MAPIRKATHAGSWYSISRESWTDSLSRECSKYPLFAGTKLDGELTGWVNAVGSTPDQPIDFPVKGCKAIIAPSV